MSETMHTRGNHPPDPLTLASRLGPQGYGGLAAYQRGLATAMGDGCPDLSIRFIQSAPPSELAPFPVVSTSARLTLAGRIFSPVWPNLASRPRMHATLERLLQSAWKADADSWPQAGGAVHFVGTGWDYFGFYALAAARAAGARFSVWPATHPGVWGDDLIDLRLYRQADVVFCQSQLEASHLVARGVRTDRVVITGLPPMCKADGNASAFREKFHLQEKLIVLYLGRLDEGKGCHALLAAWMHVVASRSDAVLVMAGSGDRPMGWDAFSPNEMIFLGAIDESTKADAIAACDIFCLPSRDESFGIVFIEAWSYAKPVICGPAPATREWVQHGVNGIHSDQNPETLAADILALLDNPKKRRDIGEAGRRFQSESLTWSRIAAIHRDAFVGHTNQNPIPAA